MHLTTLLLQIAAILLTARVLGRLFRRLRQPIVIAEIVAGIVLGPSLLGLLWPEAMALLFPPTSLEQLGTVANLGLVFFMFLVGLEFDPRLLQNQMRASLAVSNVGIVVPLLMGAGLAVPLYAELAPPGVPLFPFALFLGTAMSITAFPVLARILTERRLIQTQVGALALAAAAVGDVTAWCLLPVVVGVASAGALAPAAVTTAGALVYGVVVWFVLRPVLARIGPRTGTTISSEVIALVFFLIVVSAAITEWIGVHALFGAFLIGAAMPRERDLTRALMEKMEDFVAVALLPIFFAYSGLRTQIGLLDSGHDWALAGLIVLVATAGKLGGTLLVGRWMGLPLREATALGVLMNTRGLMELVVLNIGLDLGIIGPSLFAMMVVMALVTTWITSPLLAWLEPQQYRPEERALPQPTAGRAGVLLCISDPAVAPSLVRVAHAWVGSTHQPTWALHLRPVERPHDYLRPDGSPDLPPLEAVARQAQALSLPITPISFPSASLGADIVAVAQQHLVALVLLGVHRTTLGWDNLGGVVGTVLHRSQAEVAVLVDRGLGDLRRFHLIADRSLHGQAAARLAEQLARAGVEHLPHPTGADLIVVAWSPGVQIPSGEASCLIVRGASDPEPPHSRGNDQL